MSITAALLVGSHLTSCTRSATPPAAPDPAPPHSEVLDPEAVPSKAFPFEIAPSNPSQIVRDEETGASLVANEVLLIVHTGTPRERIDALVLAIGGTVVGTTGETLQIRIQGDGTRAGVLKAIETLSAFPETEVAEPNYVADLDGG